MTSSTLQFTNSLREGKAFAAEPKIRELKSRMSKLRLTYDKQKAKIPAVTITKQSDENMNNVKSEKYGISLNVIEEKSLSTQRFRTLFSFKIGEKVLVLVERIKKSAPGKLYEQTVQNIQYFNKKQCL